ncbi:MAG: prephenate dehydrogenase/arogenate dehydrogenase family protein [Actinobacteria bacterium]|nr:prephenate dehydrogenase/arogenate dehydrogenase family protein [Actinomycetota bacterium]
MGRRVAILGTGLIGGSIGLGLAAGRLGPDIVGYDPDARAAAIARKRGAVGSVAGSAAEAVTGAAMVIVCMPVDLMPASFASLEERVPPDAVVTDVGSAKGGVVRAGESAFGARFVGGHPMAGSERHGAAAADGRLFEAASWILTPTARTSSSAYASVTEVVSALGATAVALDPEVHDDLVARVSHLPQLAASALVDLAVGTGSRKELLGLAGAGFRDVTRIAASNPDLWVAIIKSNPHAVLDGLVRLEDRLRSLRHSLAGERWGELRSFLEAARSARLELFAKPEFGGHPIGLSMLVPDRPGVLAEVTTAAGELGANIEDLRIVHSTEGGRGRLELVVAGEASATRLVERLRALGYRAEKEQVS